MFAESLAALALILNLVGYRQDQVNHYRFLSALALLALGSHFFLIDAMAAGVGCWLAAVRNIIAMRTQHWLLLAVFVVINLAFLAFEWWVLQHGPLIFVAYAASLIFTVGSVVLTSATSIRRWFILAESLGLVYALAVGSIFGSIFNVVNLISIITKLWQERQAKA